MSEKSAHVAKMLTTRFLVGDRVVDWQGDQATIIRVSADGLLKVRYDDEMYGTASYQPGTFTLIT